MHIFSLSRTVSFLHFTLIIYLNFFFFGVKIDHITVLKGTPEVKMIIFITHVLASITMTTNPHNMIKFIGELSMIKCKKSRSCLWFVRLHYH